MTTGNVTPDVILSDVAAFKWDNFALNEMLHGQDGPVVKDLVRRGLLVASSAKQHARGRPGPNVVTGRLINSITWRLGVDGTSPFVDVGTAVEYAIFLELGTKRMPKYPFLRPALEAARASF